MTYLLAWLAMLAVSVANGSLRDFTYGRHLPERLAQQISTLTGILLLGLVMALILRSWPPASGREAWAIGLFWLALTVAFEFLFFHYVAGHPWPELLANYRLDQGRLWPLVLVWVAVFPYLFLRLQRG